MSFRDLSIRFDNDYEKLPKAADGLKAVLQLALVIDPALQTKAFLDYDTKVRGKDAYFPLKKGKLYLLLVYTIPSEVPGRGAGTFFTTLREFDINKEMHYRSATGDVFRITQETGGAFRVELVNESNYDRLKEPTHESNAHQERESNDIPSTGTV